MPRNKKVKLPSVVKTTLAPIPEVDEEESKKIVAAVLIFVDFRCTTPGCNGRFRNPYVRSDLEYLIKSLEHYSTPAGKTCWRCQKPSLVWTIDGAQPV